MTNTAVTATMLKAISVREGEGLAHCPMCTHTVPAQILMTKAEHEEWAGITSDQDAESFIRLFWARRDPSPDSSENEFQREFERRAAYADQKFAYKTDKGEQVRGALTDRGRVFIHLGAPRRVQQPGAGGVAGGLAA